MIDNNDSDGDSNSNPIEYEIIRNMTNQPLYNINTKTSRKCDNLIRKTCMRK